MIPEEVKIRSSKASFPPLSTDCLKSKVPSDLLSLIRALFSFNAPQII